jgi:hypothetical protein
MFPGFFEMNYFKQAVISTTASENQAIFGSINLYNGAIGTNYENLFVTYDLIKGVGTPPLEDSLFNTDTMQMLVQLG